MIRRFPSFARPCLGLLVSALSLSLSLSAADPAIAPAPAAPSLTLEGATHLAFVVDTSGSMHDPTTERIRDDVHFALRDLLNANPQVLYVQLLDADGRYVAGAGGAWFANDASSRARLTRALEQYQAFSNSSPLPGLVRALRDLGDPSDATMHFHVCVLGDEFIGQTTAALREIDQWNPADSQGHRAAAISAVRFPPREELGEPTFVHFVDAMTEITRAHGGRFIVLP